VQTRHTRIVPFLGRTAVSALRGRLHYARTPALCIQQSLQSYDRSTVQPPIEAADTACSVDVVGRSHQALTEYQAGILADYVPYTPLTAQNLKKLADLKPKTLAIMHGSSFTGDCVRALEDLNVAFREVFGRQK
jgi:hypothetical protein